MRTIRIDLACHIWAREVVATVPVVTSSGSLGDREMAHPTRFRKTVAAKIVKETARLPADGSRRSPRWRKYFAFGPALAPIAMVFGLWGQYETRS